MFCFSVIASDGLNVTRVCSPELEVLCCVMDALLLSAFRISCSLQEPPDPPIAAPQLVVVCAVRVYCCVMIVVS